MWRALVSQFVVPGAILFLAVNSPATCPGQDALWVQSARQIEKEQAILQALEQEISVDFQETPLTEALALISARAQVNIVPDLRAIEEEGLDINVAVTLKVSQISMSAVLSLVVMQHGLAWNIDQEVVLISTPLRCDEMQVARVYPVEDLVTAALPVGLSGEPSELDRDFDSLIEVITTTVAPDSWEESGGTGLIGKFPGSDVLVVTQTRDVHRNVSALLEALRRARRGSSSRGEILLRGAVAVFSGQHDSPTQRLGHGVAQLQGGDAALPGRAVVPGGRVRVGRAPPRWWLPVSYDAASK